MIKLIIVTLVLFTAFIQHNCAFDTDEYVAYIDELSRDEAFLEEYAAWSSKLFSQPDYLYGKKRRKFPCSTAKHTDVPTSVHALRPSDVKCVGAIGDSLTAGLGAHAITPIGLLFENRGVAWSIGGDHTYERTLSLPNILRKYTPDLDGFSTKVSAIILKGQNATHNGLNVAKSGAKSGDMPGQAVLLKDRLEKDEHCDWNNDWKVITLFIGGNDLCSYCKDAPNDTKSEPEQYKNNVRAALDILSAIPRTLVNLVLVLDVRGVEELNSGGLVCRLLHNKTCPCAAYPKPAERPTLERYIHDYQQLLFELVQNGTYDAHDNFTVVVQPFMANTTLPRNENNEIDFSYFAPDCFHFSAKGHTEAARSLWNNMLEPVGGKRSAWHTNEPFNCPSEEYPYIFTAKNSAKALEAYQRTTIAKTTRANTHTRPELSAMKTTKPARSTSDHQKHHKHHKSDSYWTKMNFAVFVGIFFVLMMILIVAMSKREKIRGFLHKTRRRHINGFTNPQYSDENDDVDIWNRSTIKTGFSLNNSLPKTHGTRVILD